MAPLFATQAHNETLATMFIFQVDDIVYVEASLEKKHLSYALNKDGNCSSDNMMEICGENYLLKHIIVSINGKQVVLEKIATFSTNDFINLHYKVSNTPPLATISVKSNYMLEYNDHSRVKAIIDLDGQVSTYFLGCSRKEIIAKID